MIPLPPWLRSLRREGARVDHGRDGPSFESEARLFGSLDEHSRSRRSAGTLWNLLLSGAALVSWVTANHLQRPALKLGSIALASVLSGAAMVYEDLLKPWFQLRADRRLTRTMDEISAQEGHHLLLTTGGSCST